MLLGVQFALAQSKKIDSLQQVLKTEPRDTHRVSLLNTLADQLKFSAYQLAIDYLNEATHLADSLHFTSGLAAAKVCNGELQLHLGAFDLSMASSLEALKLYESIGNDRGIARSWMSIGLVHSQLRQHEKALTALEKASSHYEKGKDARGRISALHNMSVVYSNVGDTLKAREQLLDNLKILQGTTYSAHFAATYNNLANLMDPIKEGDSAIALYEMALEYKYKAAIPSKSSIGNTHMNIATVHLKRGALALAEKQLRKADPLVMESKEKIRILQLHQLWGQLYFKMGRYKESAVHFEQQTIIQDSIYQPQMAEQAVQLEAAYQNKSQQLEIELLNKEKLLVEEAKIRDKKEKSRWMWLAIGISGGFLMTVALLVVLIVRGKEKNRMMSLLKLKNDEIKRQQDEILLQNEVLSLQNKQLEQVNNEKDGLIGIVAHDLRAPLNRSAALAELIATIGHLSPEQDKFAQMIKKVSDEGGRLIQDLLELNAYESQQLGVEWANVDLALVIDHSLHGFSKAAEDKSIEIHWQPLKTMGNTDEKLLGRILDNLISNAIKFTPQGKSIQISILQEKDKNWILVQDEGPGITQEDQKKMFLKFQRLTARPTAGESSTGLGLSIVKALATRIHAELSFVSTMGKGTTFKIGIPSSK
jgi:signal transduction histidine kinase